MNESEKRLSPEQKGASPEQHYELYEKLRQNHERELQSPERHHDTERARVEAEQIAHELQQSSHTNAPEAQPKRERGGIITKASRRASFNKTMKEMQKDLSPASRSFSKVIHTAPVEKASEAIGSSIARPNAILAGAVSAFVLTLVLYFVARHYGYPLSGFESIATFILGWIVGLVFDAVRGIVTGKH